LICTEGVGVSLICDEKSFLPFLEKDCKESLVKRMKRDHVLFVHDEVNEIMIDEEFNCVRVGLTRKSKAQPDQILPDRRLKVDTVLYRYNKFQAVTAILSPP
jgi:hypothetical protein